MYLNPLKVGVTRKEVFQSPNAIGRYPSGILNIFTIPKLILPSMFRIVWLYHAGLNVMEWLQKFPLYH